MDLKYGRKKIIANIGILIQIITIQHEFGY